MLRLVGTIHVATGGVELLSASSVTSMGSNLRPRDLCALMVAQAEAPHQEGRYMATSNDAAGIAHVVGPQTVDVAKIILDEHMKVRHETERRPVCLHACGRIRRQPRSCGRRQLVGSIHSASQVRYVPLLQSQGFIIMASDVHHTLNMNVDTFIELSKLAMRASLGVYVCLDPVKWKGYASRALLDKPSPCSQVDADPCRALSSSEAFASEFVKTGGHLLHAFIKADPPESSTDPGFITISNRLNAVNVSMATFRASLYRAPADMYNMQSAQIARRLQAPSKVLQAAAFACKRTDLLLADKPDDDWHGKTVAEEAQLHQDPKKKQDDEYWKDTARQAQLHKHMLRLAVTVAKAVDASKGTNDAKHFSGELPNYGGTGP